MTKEIKQAKNTTVEFTVKMAGVIVWLSTLSLGIYAIYLGKDKTSLTLCAVGLTFAGVLNVIVSFFVLFRVLISKEG